VRWQLPIVWLIGSLITGTIAVLHAPDDGLVPLIMLSREQLFTLVVLVGALFIGLFAVGWRTIEATWLRWQDTRSVILWASLVGGAGLAGWGFAAVVTFDAGFPLTTQLILAYTCGGLPFTLVAGMLARPVRVNIAAVVLTFVAGLTGLAIMDAPLPTLAWYLVGITPS
jgi:hypothetical protein